MPAYKIFMPQRAITTCLAVLLCAVGMYSADGFRAALLADMAQTMGMTDTIMTMPDGVHVAELAYKGQPVTVTVHNGKVTHVGYSVFGAEHRAIAYSPAFDVVERLALLNSLKLSGHRSATRMLEDVGGEVRKGNLAMLPSLFGDTLVSVSVRNINGKYYKLDWRRGDKDIAEVRIPYTFSLLHGTEMEEDEENLVADLLQAKETADSSMFVTPTVTRDDLVSLFPTGYYLLPGEAYYFDTFNANRYYTNADSVTYVPICDERFPIETMANIATSMEVPNNLSVAVKIIRYDYKHTVVELPLSAMVNYFLQNGCKPFFGVISQDADSKQYELLMRNETEGYCHLIKLVEHTPEDVPATLTARLSPYIPVSKIASLFGEDNSAWQSSHKNKIKYNR